MPVYFSQFSNLFYTCCSIFFCNWLQYYCNLIFNWFRSSRVDCNGGTRVFLIYPQKKRLHDVKSRDQRILNSLWFFPYYPRIREVYLCFSFAKTNLIYIFQLLIPSTYALSSRCTDLVMPTKIALYSYYWFTFQNCNAQNNLWCPVSICEDITYRSKR